MATLVEKSYTHIRGKLGRGELQPGDRVVTRTLADELGVSLAPVREAISRLTTEGVLDYTAGAGASVRAFDRRELEELYVLREANESYAAREAARNAADYELEELAVLNAEMRSLAEEVERLADAHATEELFGRWLDNEERFHETLVEASRNRLLVKVVREHRLVHRVFQSQRQSAALLTPYVARKSFENRERLLAAIVARDGESARRITSENIELGRRTVTEFLRRNPPAE